MSGIPRLRELRKLRDLTQGELSNLSGVPTGTISRLEKGRREPHFRTVRKLADSLGVMPSVLLDGGAPVQGVNAENEVLEAAKELLEWIDTGTGSGPLRLATLRVAVAKVEGKT